MSQAQVRGYLPYVDARIFHSVLLLYERPQARIRPRVAFIALQPCGSLQCRCNPFKRLMVENRRPSPDAHLLKRVQAARVDDRPVALDRRHRQIQLLGNLVQGRPVEQHLPRSHPADHAGKVLGLGKHRCANPVGRNALAAWVGSRSFRRGAIEATVRMALRFSSSNQYMFSTGLESISRKYFRRRLASMFRVSTRLAGLPKRLLTFVKLRLK